jgi:hypothetical protein
MSPPASDRRPGALLACALAACIGVARGQPPAVAEPQPPMDAAADEFDAPAPGAARGVNPADNLTKFELQPRLSAIDDSGGVSITTMTVKYDRAIQGRYGVNVELPIARFQAPGLAENGYGDLNVRGRFQTRVGRMTFIAGVEAVLPAASDDLLGSGKWQLNPTVAAVYPLARTTFLAGVIKSVNSVAGDDDRADLSQLQLRGLFGYSAPKGWWLLVDPQYWIDREANDRNEFVLEVEYGRMVGQTTGVWLRTGSRLGGNWNRGEWTVGGGIRFISF